MPKHPDFAPHGAVGTPTELARWRRLRLAGIVLPILFIVALQILRPFVSDNALPDTGQAFLDATTAVAAVVFGLIMFRKFDQWNDVLLGANRELAVRDAVATAVRDAGESAAEVAIAAARSVQAASGALGVVVHLEETGETWDAVGPREYPDPMHAGRHGAGAADVDDVAWDRADVVTTTIGVPLKAAHSTVGSLRITMPVRYTLSDSADGAVDRSTDMLTPATVEAISQQIGSALHRAVLKEHLQRSLRNQRAISRVLVEVTSNPDLAAGLLTVISTARQLTDAHAAGLRVSPAAVPALHPDPSAEHICITDAVHVCAEASHQCPHTQVPGTQIVTRPLRGIDGSFGELWVALDDDAPTPSPVAAGDVNALTSEAGAQGAVLADLTELAYVALEHGRLLDDERGAAAVREREWIAREMHDSLAQVLGVLHLRLRSLEPLVGSVPAQDAAREMADLADIAHDAFVDVREAILGLRESVSGDRSFLDALNGYAAKYERQSGVRTHVDVQGRIELTPAAEVQVLRVVQEALTNIRKHARAHSALITLRRSGSMVTVGISDDGVGFDVSTSRSFDTFGMSSMRERTELVGGTLTIDSAAGQGTRITATIPTFGSPVTPPALSPSVSRGRPA